MTWGLDPAPLVPEFKGFSPPRDRDRGEGSASLISSSSYATSEDISITLPSSSGSSIFLRFPVSCEGLDLEVVAVSGSGGSSPPDVARFFPFPVFRALEGR
jgi:hypothetical protein